MNELKDILQEEFETSYQINKINKQEAILTSKSNAANSIMIGWTNLGLSISFDSVIGLKNYREVETIMTKVVKESQIQINCFGKTQNTINIFRKIEKNETNYINNDNLRVQIQKIKRIVEDEIESTFDKVSSVQKLAQHVNTLNEKEISEFLSNPTLIRKLAINIVADKEFRIDNEVNRIKGEYHDAEIQYPEVFKNYTNAIEIFDKLIKSS